MDTGIYRPLKRRSVPFQGLKRSPRWKSRALQVHEIESTSEATDHGSAAAVDASSELICNTSSTVQGPAPIPVPDDDEASVWRVCLAVRLINSLLVQTYFIPDEHWQVLEVAHRITFGYGHLTWEWQKGLRSYVHPLVFAGLYKMLDVLHLDNPWFMRRAPRLFQSIIAAVGDLYLYRLSYRLFGERAAQWALFCQLSNWFNFYCMSRTFSHCMETVLTTIALYHWWPVSKTKPRVGLLTSRQLGVLSAGLACVMRPASAITWAYVGTSYWRNTSVNKQQFIYEDVLPTGVLCLGLMTLVDRVMYGKWTFVLVNNVLSSGGAFSGTCPWHWYISHGLPVMAFTFLPLSLAGMWWSEQWELCGLIAWILGIYSILGHKELRFILPVLPLAMMFAGYAIAVLEQRWAWEGPARYNACKLQPNDQETCADGPPPGLWARVTSGVKHRKRFSIGAQRGYKKLWGVLMLLLLTNLPAALYSSLIHQRGSESVMEDLANKAQAGGVESLLFLMPCHATPYYASLHTNISMRFLDCSPSDEPGYVDEAHRFMAHPVSFLYSMYSSRNAELPSHIVLFDSMEKRISMFLKMENYVLDKKFFHSHFPVDRELQGHVLVYTRQASRASESSWFPW